MTDTKERQTISSGAGPSFIRRRRLNWLLWLIGFGFLALVAFTIGCMAGPVGISPLSILKIFLSKLGLRGALSGWSNTEELIVIGIRLPRVVTGLAVGAALGVVGAAFQCILKNPLADPFILGVSSGAALGATLAIVFGVSIPFLPGVGVPMIAFLGAMLATLLIYRIAMVHGSIDPHTLILCGVILNAFLSSVMMMVYTAARPTKIHSLLLWLMGDLESAGEWVLLPLFVMLVGTISLFAFARSMNALTLGDEPAFALGIDVLKVKRAIFLICAVVIGSAVSATGMIGFVGLLAPHISRGLVTSDHRFVLPSSALIGAALVVLADAFGRWVLAPAELPVGAVTSLIGAPFFIYLLKKRAKVVWGG